MKFKSLPKAFGTAAAGALIAATCVVANSSAAAAADYYNYDAPTKATDVRTFKVYTAGSGAQLQLRMGKYKGSWYRWARVSKPDSNLNKKYNLYFARWGDPGQCKVVDGGYTKDIDGTTYTPALKVTDAQAPYCTYRAAWSEKGKPTTGKYIDWNGR
ncbi:hypothetical protein FAF44_48990 [Nonomuraea sp. MG754425]|uniref:hypothetical protein n=1 Tax=Nonomuraea sp. MG754425 TaxID=2570319 RepID=UPI001F3F14C2|nr:hypothetical protein [Nonomuraea sp. MG754425]MCF6476227.1 hypothetical protein [Nonomuraea sp. MG754425]